MAQHREKAVHMRKYGTNIRDVITSREVAQHRTMIVQSRASLPGFELKIEHVTFTQRRKRSHDHRTIYL